MLCLRSSQISFIYPGSLKKKKKKKIKEGQNQKKKKKKKKIKDGQYHSDINQRLLRIWMEVGIKLFFALTVDNLGTLKRRPDGKSW